LTAESRYLIFSGQNASPFASSGLSEHRHLETAFRGGRTAPYSHRDIEDLFAKASVCEPPFSSKADPAQLEPGAD